MVLDLRIQVKVRLTIPKHIQSIIETTHMDMDSLIDTSAANHLFQVRDDGGDLSLQQKDLYRTLAENILFVSCCLQPDLKTSISLLTTRVKQPNIENYKKLARCIRYIRVTENMYLTLEANNASIMRLRINEAYGVQTYTKIHPGGIISLGK